MGTCSWKSSRKSPRQSSCSRPLLPAILWRSRQRRDLQRIAGNKGRLHELCLGDFLEDFHEQVPIGRVEIDGQAFFLSETLQSRNAREVDLFRAAVRHDRLAD